MHLGMCLERTCDMIIWLDIMSLTDQSNQRAGHCDVISTVNGNFWGQAGPKPGLNWDSIPGKSGTMWALVSLLHSL